jgi:hypothetical protein
VDNSEQVTEIACAVCNGRFVLAGHFCPSCMTYHEEEHAACIECGTPMIRLCRKCQTTNWTGDERCIECGEAIDLLSQLESMSGQSTANRLDQQMVAARVLNEAESKASDRRMAELMAIEEARQAELRRQQAKRKRQERSMLIVVFVAVILFLLAMITIALFELLG